MATRAHEELPLHENEKPEPAPAVAVEAPAPAAAPESKLSTATILSLQRTAGNTAVTRLIQRQASAAGAGGDDEDDPKNRSVGAGARARLRGSGLPPRRRAALRSAAALPPLLQRAGPDPPAPKAADDDRPLSELVLEHLQAPFDFSLESKGGESASYVKLNKVSMKGSVKISPSHVPGGEPAAGAGPSGKNSDGKKGLAVTVAAEAKQKTQTEFSKKFDAGVNDLVKAVTGKDKALKTEFFAKAKAEAKAGKSGGKPEFSSKVGYDFGVDAAVFGVGKVTMQVKLTLIGLKAKKGSKGFEFEATAFAAEPSAKLAVKWPTAFTIEQVPFDIEGSVEWGAEFEPNWAKIAADAAADVGTEAAVMLAIDFALVAGPPLLAGFVLASGIVMAGEKGRLMQNINAAAVDAKAAMMVFSQCMTGSELPGSGPHAKQAHDAAMNQLKTIASSSGMEVEELMTELRQHPASDFTKVYNQTKQQMMNAFDSEVGKMIADWRKEHYILAIWTRAEDDMEAAKQNYVPILNR